MCIRDRYNVVALLMQQDRATLESDPSGASGLREGGAFVRRFSCCSRRSAPALLEIKAINSGGLGAEPPGRCLFRFACLSDHRTVSYTHLLLVFVEDLLDELPPPDVAAMIMAITINITMPIKHPGLLELDFDGTLYEREGTFRLIDRSHC